jgi:formylmethanofuran dehydrogenase subunit E
MKAEPIDDCQADSGYALTPMLVEACAANHTRLCPRQVLGVRIGLLGAKSLGLAAPGSNKRLLAVPSSNKRLLAVPSSNKRLLAIVETDGCFADGVAVATGCSVGRRTMRVVDYGKVAATFVDVETGRAIRIAPRNGIRERAWAYAPGEPESRWHAQLAGYQAMPDTELLAAQPVELNPTLEALLGQAGDRAVCASCGEEIINQREVIEAGRVLCRACAGESYYRLGAPGF